MSLVTTIQSHTHTHTHIHTHTLSDEEVAKNISKQESPDFGDKQHNRIMINTIVFNNIETNINTKKVHIIIVSLNASHEL